MSFAELKKLWRVFIVLFLISFIFFNWSEISWIFNYRIVSGFFADSFSQERKEASIKTEQAFLEENQPAFYEKENSLEISKIGLTAPLIVLENSDMDEVVRALDKGTVHFPGSALPGQAGQTIILGHSAPLGWPKVKYDWVFSQLNELAEGDEIIVFLDNRKYEYYVTGKVFLERGEEISKNGLAEDKNALILISCWPPGKDLRRIAVEAELR